MNSNKSWEGLSPAIPCNEALQRINKHATTSLAKGSELAETRPYARFNKIDFRIQAHDTTPRLTNSLALSSGFTAKFELAIICTATETLSAIELESISEMPDLDPFKRLDSTYDTSKSHY